MFGEMRMKKYGMLKVAIASSIIVAVILIIGTILMGQSASVDTEKAVRNVSLLYLEELAERREQVVSTTLSGYISTNTENDNYCYSDFDRTGFNNFTWCVWYYRRGWSTIFPFDYNFDARSFIAISSRYGN